MGVIVSLQHYHGQQNILYYQPQPDNYNQNKQYHHYRIAQKSTYRTDYDREKLKNVVVFIVEYLHPTLKYPLLHC